MNKPEVRNAFWGSLNN